MKPWWGGGVNLLSACRDNLALSLALWENMYLNAERSSRFRKVWRQITLVSMLDIILCLTTF